MSLPFRGRFAKRASTAAAAALVVCSLAACSPYSGSPSQRVRAWATQNSFVANNDQLVGDVQRVRKAVSEHKALAMRTVCGGFAMDVGTAYTTLPTPDQQLTDDLNDADVVFGKAAQACSGATSVASGTTGRSLRQISVGIGDLISAQRRLETLGVDWKIHL